MWLPLLILVIVFETIADVLSKEWSLKPRILFLFGGVLFYLVSNIVWLLALRQGAGLARGVTVFSVATAVIAVVIGLIFYRESLSFIQLVGIFLGIAALLLIFWNDLF